jgi:hypothetical protein
MLVTECIKIAMYVYIVNIQKLSLTEQNRYLNK